MRASKKMAKNTKNKLKDINEKVVGETKASVLKITDSKELGFKGKARSSK